MVKPAEVGETSVGQTTEPQDTWNVWGSGKRGWRDQFITE